MARRARQRIPIPRGETLETSERLFAAWSADLSRWGIPEEILAAAPEEPWTFRRGVFAGRAKHQVANRGGPSVRIANEALPEGGTVIDVGSGAGAASLPLAGNASRITAVDMDPGMLAALAELAASMPSPHASVEQVVGRWPDVAPAVGPADVVCCHHVLYNVPALRPFVEALTDHAKARVVVEMTEVHPTEPMNPLWLRFHGLVRPVGPTWEDAAEAIRSLGYSVGVERWDTAPLHVYDSFDEMVAYHRRRLCLPSSADPDVAEALQELGVDPTHPVGLGQGRPMITLSWAGTADERSSSRTTRRVDAGGDGGGFGP